MVARTAALALLLLAVSGCASAQAVPSDTQGVSVAVGLPTGPCSPPAPYDGTVPQLFPEGLDLPAAATLTDVVELPAGVVVEGYAPGSVGELLEQFRGLLAAGDFRVDRLDDEVREAEVWFTGSDRQGQVVLSATRCPDGASGFRVISGFQYDITPGSGRGADAQ